MEIIYCDDCKFYYKGNCYLYSKINDWHQDNIYAKKPHDFCSCAAPLEELDNKVCEDCIFKKVLFKKDSQ